MINIQKVSICDWNDVGSICLQEGIDDNLWLNGNMLNSDNFTINITTALSLYQYSSIHFTRKVPTQAIPYLNLNLMPGFKLTWNYNRKVDQEAKYSDDFTTKEFARYKRISQTMSYYKL